MLLNSTKIASLLERFVVDGPWGSALDAEQLDLVLRSSVVQVVDKGEYAISVGAPGEHWVGVYSGLLEQVISSGDGKHTVISVAGEGAWFGEGTLLKSERWLYNVIALKRTQLLLVPKSVFDHLRGGSIAFNQYLADLLNHRLGLFVGLLINDRLLSPNIRLARNLAAMHRAKVYGSEERDLLPLNQSTLALLCGLSRQRANMGLQELQKRGLVKLRSSGVQVIDANGLSRYDG